MGLLLLASGKQSPAVAGSPLPANAGVLLNRFAKKSVIRSLAPPYTSLYFSLLPYGQCLTFGAVSWCTVRLGERSFDARMATPRLRFGLLVRHNTICKL